VRSTELIAAVGDWVAIEGPVEARMGHITSIEDNSCTIAIFNMESPKFETTSETITVSVLELLTLGIGRWAVERS
jgi:hypothetical protein